MTDAEFYGITDDEAPTTTTAPEGTLDPPAATGSRFRLLNGFVDLDMRGVADNELRVWLVIFRLTDATANAARVSYPCIADRAGCSVRTVKRVVKQLRERGLLRVVRQGGFNRGPSTLRVTTGRA